MVRFSTLNKKREVKKSKKSKSKKKKQIKTKGGGPPDVIPKPITSGSPTNDFLKEKSTSDSPDVIPKLITSGSPTNDLLKEKSTSDSPDDFIKTKEIINKYIRNSVFKKENGLVTYLKLQPIEEDTELTEKDTQLTKVDINLTLEEDLYEFFFGDKSKKNDVSEEEIEGLLNTMNNDVGRVDNELKVNPLKDNSDYNKINSFIIDNELEKNPEHKGGYHKRRKNKGKLSFSGGGWWLNLFGGAAVMFVCYAVVQVGRGASERISTRARLTKIQVDKHAFLKNNIKVCLNRIRRPITTDDRKAEYRKILEMINRSLTRENKVNIGALVWDNARTRVGDYKFNELIESINLENFTSDNEMTVDTLLQKLNYVDFDNSQ